MTAIIYVWIEPHERLEAIEAYRDWLTAGQIEAIEEAPETALIRLARADEMTGVLVVEEG